MLNKETAEHHYDVTDSVIQARTCKHGLDGLANPLHLHCCHV